MATAAKGSCRRVCSGKSNRLLKRITVAVITSRKKVANAAMSTQSSPSSAARRTMPRTSRTKCVSGNSSASHYAARGMPSKGNMKPDKRMNGRKKKKVNCIA